MKGKYVKAAYVPLIGTGAAGDIVWSDAVHVTGNGTDSGAAAVKSANAELATADITTGGKYSIVPVRERNKLLSDNSRK